MPDKFADKKTRVSKNGKTRTIIAYSVIAVFAIGLGAGGAWAYNQFFSKKASSNIVVDGTTLADDIDAVMKKYDGVKNRSSLHTELTPYEMIDVAMHKFSTSPYYFEVGKGSTSAAIADQVIYASFVKNDKAYFEESISTGLINLYDRMYMEGNSTDCYWGGSSNYAGMKKKSYDNEEYKSLMGRNISTPSSYVVSKKTCLFKSSPSGRGVTSSSKTSDGYEVEIELNPGDDKGVSGYRLQMKTVSSLAALPSFYYCHLSFKLDFDLNFVESTVYESYWAQQSEMIGAKMVATIRSKYFTYSSAEEAQKIPDLNTTIDYSKYF